MKKHRKFKWGIGYCVNEIWTALQTDYKSFVYLDKYNNEFVKPVLTKKKL